MKHLRIRQQLSVTDPLQRERLLRALKLILEHQEEPDASRTLCQGLAPQLATGEHDPFANPVAQTTHSTAAMGVAAGA